MYIHEHPEWWKFRYDAVSLMPLLGEVRYKQGKIAGLMENAARDLKVDASKITLADDIIGSAGFSGKDYTRGDVMKVLNIALGRRKADIAGFQISNELEGIVQVTLDTTLNYKQRFNERRLFSWCEQLFPTGYSGLIKMEAGKYRTHEMQAVTGTPGEEEKIHYEAPAPERIQSEMNRFFDWFNTPGTRPFDNMLRAGVAYFWILTIHPFEDGNGRVARAVSDLLLARSDDSNFRYYSPNITLRFERERYYSCLEEAQNGDGDLTHWLTNYLQSVRDSMDRPAVSIALGKSAFWAQNSQQSLNKRQIFALNKLLEWKTGFLKEPMPSSDASSVSEPRMTTTQYASLCDCSQDTALRDIQVLMEKGLLKSTAKSGRNAAYILKG